MPTKMLCLIALYSKAYIKYKHFEASVLLFGNIITALLHIVPAKPVLNVKDVFSNQMMSMN